MTRNREIETVALQRQTARLVEREVQCCMSSLIATLAQGAGLIERGAKRSPAWGGASLGALADQAVELAVPVLDYESAALDAGFSPNGKGYWWNGDVCGDDEPMFWTDAAQACSEQDIEPHECEIYEHWAVSQWLSEKLIGKGERVDTDFAGLNVWARTTTGQAISADNVIEAIVAETGYASAV